MVSLKLKSSGFQPIGLDIGHSSIRMVQLAVGAGGVKVIAADRQRIDPDIDGDEQARRDFIISAIKKMWARSGFRGKDAVSCLSNDRVQMTSLRLTGDECDRLEQVLRKELVQRFAMDPEKDSINCIRAGDVVQGDQMRTELIVFAADDRTIRAHIETIEQAGLRLAGIDVVPCALFRSFERSLRRQEDKEKTVVFIDVGSRFTTVVFGRGGQIGFVKQIPMGGDKFNQQLAEKLSVDVAEAQILRSALRMEKQAKDGNGSMQPADDDNPGSQSGSDGIELDPATRQGMIDAIGAVAEQLAGEIALCFRYYTVTFRGKRVERAVVAGGEAYESILLNVLKRRLAVEVEQAQPFRGFDMSDVNLDACKRGLLSEWVVAVGLGLKGCSNDR